MSFVQFRPQGQLACVAGFVRSTYRLRSLVASVRAYRRWLSPVLGVAPAPPLRGTRNPIWPEHVGTPRAPASSHSFPSIRRRRTAVRPGCRTGQRHQRASEEATLRQYSPAMTARRYPRRRRHLLFFKQAAK
jgi:hypothetical protein